MKLNLKTLEKKIIIIKHFRNAERRKCFNCATLSDEYCLRDPHTCFETTRERLRDYDCVSVREGRRRRGREGEGERSKNSLKL